MNKDNSSEKELTGNILMVDDDDVMLEDYFTLLKMKFPAVSFTAAKSAEEALEMIRNSEPFDLVITDMRMPTGSEGLHVVKAARDKDPVTEIIVITAHGDLENVYEAIERGANQYLDKSLPQALEIQFRTIESRLRLVQTVRSIEDIDGYSSESVYMHALKKAVQVIQGRTYVSDAGEEQ